MKDIYDKYDKLNSVDKSILQYIIKNFDDVKDMSVNEIAKKVYVSKTTLINLSQKLNFKGFSEFRYYLKNNKYTTIEKTKNEDVLSMIKNECDKTLALQDNEKLYEISNIILNSKVVYIFSRGASAPFGDYLSTRLSMLNVKVIFISDINILDVVIQHITNEEMMIMLSQSGSTKIITDTAKKLQVKGINTLSITSFIDNLLSRYTKYHIYFYSDTLNTQEKDTHSRVGMNIATQILIEYIKGNKKNE